MNLDEIKQRAGAARGRMWAIPALLTYSEAIAMIAEIERLRAGLEQIRKSEGRAYRELARELLEGKR